MRNSEMTAAIAEKADLSEKKAKQLLDAITGAITAGAADGPVMLDGFGTFEERQGHGVNPKTGEPVTAAAAPTLRFKPSKNLTGSINP
ncbi:HU family DNA-binding protein [Streptomyces sp. NPDC002225]|uniref:HU family DNA-binding protein n=1 Tax=Streptomyces sp. NPDC002225 TaxID=3154413 RepID=UPI00331D1962